MQTYHRLRSPHNFSADAEPQLDRCFESESYWTMLREIYCPNCGTKYRIPAHIPVAHYQCSVCHYPRLEATGAFAPNPTIQVVPPRPGATSPRQGVPGVTGPTAENRSNDALLGAFAFGATGAAIAGPPGAVIGALLGLVVGGARQKPQTKP